MLRNAIKPKTVKAIPPDNPSMPSIALNAFMMVMIIKIVIGSDRTPKFQLNKNEDPVFST